MDFDFIQPLLKRNKSKIVLLVMDGLGGLPQTPDGLTELETAKTPNLDHLAAEGITGLHQPIAPGITPGSGPSHLALFGYDPVKYEVGRGVLAALGINFDLQASDVAARGNFCTIDENGLVTDRRAGRISTEKNQELCEILGQIKVPGVEVFVQTVKEHRFLLVLRGENLNGEIHDTDPQVTGEAPLAAKPLVPEAKETARLIDEFAAGAREALADHHPANMVLLRGFSQKPDWPTMEQAFGLKAAAIAGYPMYRGVAKLIGMEVIETGATTEEEFETLKQNWNDFDFFYVHVKKVDSAGEDGDFNRKVTIIEDVDRHLPKLLELKPDVLIVTGDHSTPSVLKSHSWNPVPVLIHSKYCRTDPVKAFGERACMAGGLGCRFPAVDMLPIALANTLRLEKFGA